MLHTSSISVAVVTLGPQIVSDSHTYHRIAVLVLHESAFYQIWVIQHQTVCRYYIKSIRGRETHGKFQAYIPTWSKFILDTCCQRESDSCHTFHGFWSQRQSHSCSHIRRKPTTFTISQSITIRPKVILKLQSYIIYGMLCQA